MLSKDAKGLGVAFSRAEFLARRDSEWLSLLKRVRLAQAARNTGLYATVADRALKAFPKSESVAAAATYAYLRSGFPSKALSLFKGPLSADARPKLWAECFIESESGPEPPYAAPSDYARLAEVTEYPRAYLGAAATALVAGDKTAGAAWLRKGMAAGASPSSTLLWDCGLYGDLAARSDAGAGSAELALMGDAAWKTGEVSTAKTRWSRSIALEPRRSWKAYANLALTSEPEVAESYWTRIKSAFLAGPASELRDGALAVYVARLGREDRDKEALALLAGGAIGKSREGRLAVLDLTLRGRSMPEGRFAVEFERLVALRPDDPLVVETALRSFLQRGLFGEAALLEAGAEKRALALERGWYYKAAILAARSDFKAAVAALEGSPAAQASYEGSYALGSLYEAMGRPGDSAKAYARAGRAARGPGARAAALKSLGRELGAMGDAGGSAKAYAAAAAEDPRDPEAALLARGSSPRK